MEFAGKVALITGGYGGMVHSDDGRVSRAQAERSHQTSDHDVRLFMGRGLLEAF